MAAIVDVTLPCPHLGVTGKDCPVLCDVSKMANIHVVFIMQNKALPRSSHQDPEVVQVEVGALELARRSWSVASY
jgi:hypothetical protein